MRNVLIHFNIDPHLWLWQAKFSVVDYYNSNGTLIPIICDANLSDEEFYLLAPEAIKQQALKDLE